MIYFIFPFDWGLFWGNQALTVGPVLWLSCLHSSAGDMLTLRRAETKSCAALKVWTVFGSELACCGEGQVNQGKEKGKEQVGQRTGRIREIREEQNIIYSGVKGKIPPNLT